MLVLGRKVDEALVMTIPAGTVIPDGFEIRVAPIDLRGRNVRMGIAAPQNVRVLRSELVPGGEEVAGG